MIEQAFQGNLLDQSRKVVENGVYLWGEDAQLDMAIEEMSELTQAILKLRRYPNDEQRKEDAREECADALFMIFETAVILGEEEVLDWFKKKVNRTELRQIDQLEDKRIAESALELERQEFINEIRTMR